MNSLQPKVKDAKRIMVLIKDEALMEGRKGGREGREGRRGKEKATPSLILLSTDKKCTT